MLSRRLDLTALLRTVSVGRLALAILAVLWVTPLPSESSSAWLTWGVVAPLDLLLWYAVATAVHRLARAVPVGPQRWGAHVAVGLGCAWAVHLLAPWLWLYACTALAAAAYAAARLTARR